MSFGLTGLKYKHRFTRLRGLMDLITPKEKKVVLTTYLEKNERLFERVHMLLGMYNMPVVGFVVRKKDKTGGYKVPFRRNGIIDVGIGDTASVEAIDLLINSLVDVGC